MPPFNINDWFWIVGNDTSRLWSSKISDWTLSSPDGAGITYIDTEYNLSVVLTDAGLIGPVPIPPAQVPMWAVRTVLQNDGLFDQAQALINASSDNALKNVWEYGNFADRNSTAITTLAAALNLTNAQVDQMFIDANNLSV